MTTMRNWVEIQRKGKGRDKGTTEIQNNSESTIFLIPIFCAGSAAPQLVGTVVDKDLVSMIPAKGSINVKNADYNETGKNYNCQTYILFRAAETDNIEKFRKILVNKVIKVETVERLLLHDELYGHNLELKCHEAKDIGDGSVVQVVSDEKLFMYEVAQKKKEEDKGDIQKPVTLQTLVGLIMVVLAKQGGLKEDIKALQEKMESLKKA